MNTSALALRPNSSQGPKNQGDTYLRFHLSQKTSAAISMSRAQEVIVLPVARLTPMPNMPPYIMGLMNRRSRVLWVVELARMLGLPPVESNGQHHNVIIIRDETTAFGLVVQAVDGVMRLVPEGIQAPLGHLPQGLIPYLHGCVLQEQDVLLVLAAEAIMRSPLLHNP